MTNAIAPRLHADEPEAPVLLARAAPDQRRLRQVEDEPRRAEPRRATATNGVIGPEAVRARTRPGTNPMIADHRRGGGPSSG